MKWESDNEFSLHKDRILHCYWSQLAFGGRFILASSKYLQKEVGIDGIIQITPARSISFDTKHVRGLYQNFYLEELSCSKNNTPGWILKDSQWLDIIFYCFWPFCSKCYKKDCNNCKKVLSSVIYAIPFFELKRWFVANKDKYSLHVNNTFNKTNGRIVPIRIIEKEIGARRIREFNNLSATAGCYKKKSYIGDFFNSTEIINMWYKDSKTNSL